MKTLYLILSKLKAMICEDKFFFTVFCVGIFVCNIMFTYMYGVLRSVVDLDGIPDFYMISQGGDRMSAEDVEALFENQRAELVYYAAIDPDSSDRFELGEDPGSQWDVRPENLVIRARRDVTYYYSRYGDTGRLERKGTVMAPENLVGVSIGDTVRLNGKDLEVVGVTSYDSFTMSLETFSACGFFPDQIAVDCPVSDIGKIRDILSATSYRIETVNEEIFDAALKRDMATVFIIYLACVFAFAYLVKSLYDDSAYELNVYAMLGASGVRTMTVFSGAMFIVLAVVCFASQAFHAALYDSLFSKMNMFGPYTYTLGDYAGLFAVTFLSVFAFVFIYVLLRVRRSSIVNARKFIA